jgi:hypothetical protein
MNALPPLSAGQLKLIVKEYPARVYVNRDFIIKAVVCNFTHFILNSFDPFPVHISYHWMDKKAVENIVFEGQRSNLMPMLSAGEERSYTVRIKAPPEGGRYLLRVTLVQEHVRWFDATPTLLTQDVYIIVE